MIRLWYHLQQPRRQRQYLRCNYPYRHQLLNTMRLHGRTIYAARLPKAPSQHLGCRRKLQTRILCIRTVLPDTSVPIQCRCKRRPNTLAICNCRVVTKATATNRHACLVLVYGNSGSIPHKDHGEERDFVLHIVGTTTTTTTTSDTDTGVTNDNSDKTYKSVSQCVMDPMSGQYKVHVTTPIDTIEVKIILRHYHPRCGTNQNVENDNGMRCRGLPGLGGDEQRAFRLLIWFYL